MLVRSCFTGNIVSTAAQWFENGRFLFRREDTGVCLGEEEVCGLAMTGNDVKLLCLWDRSNQISQDWC